MEFVNGWTIVDAEEADRKSWTDFVYRHANGNIFQTPYMYDVYFRTPNYTPIFYAIQEGQTIKGVLLGVVMRAALNLGWPTSYSVVMGGPLVDDEDTDVAAILLDVYERAIRGKVLFSQFRNLFDMDWFNEALSRREYQYEAHLNYLINLRQDASLLWEELSPTCKNKINKANKLGVEIRQFSTEREMENAYDILREVYGRIKYPLADKSLFLEALVQLSSSENIMLVGAYLENKMIAMRMLLVYKGVWYDWYAGSLRQYAAFSPNELLTWHIINLAKERGASVFDFGGAGNPSIPYGVRDYKRKFGGEEVDFGRCERVYHLKFYAFIKRFILRKV